MEAAHPSEAARRLLALRRSASADRMTEPGPDDETLDAILEMAARVPDHRKIVPFRFIVFSRAARVRLGDVIAERFVAANPDATHERIEAERRKLLRAPVVVAVVACIDSAHKTPAWEQELTNGAVCLNLLLAASAYGFGANWLTEWHSYDERVMNALGLKGAERLSGFVYIGTPTEKPRERQRPQMAEIVSRM
ncbi:MAG: nitroreductase [Parvularculaceae bacterium]|nr:nitroreductase [Parvularculaceae bacterium]